jgi:hypothetical protein
MQWNRLYKYRKVYGSKTWAERASCRLTAMMRHVSQGVRRGDSWVTDIGIIGTHAIQDSPGSIQDTPPPAHGTPPLQSTTSVVAGGPTANFLVVLTVLFHALVVWLPDSNVRKARRRFVCSRTCASCWMMPCRQRHALDGGKLCPVHHQRKHPMRHPTPPRSNSDHRCLQRRPHPSQSTR